MTPADDPAGAVPDDPPAYPWRSPAGPVAPSRSRARALQGRRAGLVTRGLANALDAGVVVLVLLGGYAALAIWRFLVNPPAFRFPAPSFGALILLGGAVQAVYFAIAWATAGRTYGDEVLGLTVVGRRSGRLGWPAAGIRALLCVLLPIGLLWVLVSPRNRSVQDVLLQTSVIYDWPEAR